MEYEREQYSWGPELAVLLGQDPDIRDSAVLLWSVGDAYSMAHLPQKPGAPERIQGG